MHRSSGSLQLSVHLCLYLRWRLHSYWLQGPAVPRSWSLEFLTAVLCQYVCKSFYFSLSVLCKRFTKSNTPVEFDCLSISFLVVQCPALQELENGLTSCGDDEDREFSYGNTCSFSCVPGYHLVGPTTITCTSAAVWTDSVPRCAGESGTAFSCVLFQEFAHLSWLTCLVFHQSSLARTREETLPSSASAATLWPSCSLARHAASTAKRALNCREPRPFSVLGKDGGIKQCLPAKVWKPKIITKVPLYFPVFLTIIFLWLQRQDVLFLWFHQMSRWAAVPLRLRLLLLSLLSLWAWSAFLAVMRATSCRVHSAQSVWIRANGALTPLPAQVLNSNSFKRAKQLKPVELCGGDYMW